VLVGAGVASARLGTQISTFHPPSSARPDFKDFGRIGSERIPSENNQTGKLTRSNRALLDSFDMRLAQMPKPDARPNTASMPFTRSSQVTIDEYHLLTSYWRFASKQSRCTL